MVAAAVGERDPGPEHQRWDHARNQHLARRGERHDARGDVHRDAVDVPVGHLHLPGVQPGANLDPTNEVVASALAAGECTEPSKPYSNKANKPRLDTGLLLGGHKDRASKSTEPQDDV